MGSYVNLPPADSTRVSGGFPWNRLVIGSRLRQKNAPNRPRFRSGEGHINFLVYLQKLSGLSPENPDRPRVRILSGSALRTDPADPQSLDPIILIMGSNRPPWRLGRF